MRVVDSSFLPFGRPAQTPTFGILSTYPPTACGLATFSAALARGLRTHGAEVSVVRIADRDLATNHPTNEDVVGHLVNGSSRSVAGCSDLLNQRDVAVVQHEYGLFGGTDGDEVLEILGGLQVPAIVIAHTILTHPTPHQRSVLVAVADVAHRVVVMSEAARARLCTIFDVDPAKVAIIPHGAALPARRSPSKAPGRPMLLTWGLLGPGKGIERVVDAMGSLHDLPSRPVYLVAGQTHPKVLAADGEAYRNARIEQARRIGVRASVVFDADYRDVPSLTGLIQSSAVVVLPYDSTEQVTSGVLVDAIAAGRPVVATAFPHAVELLASGAGIVVDHNDEDALASALHRLLTDDALAGRMAAEATRLAPSMAWPVVAGAYARLAEDVLAEQAALV